MRIFAIILILVFHSISLNAQIPAFEGAVGSGAHTSGFRASNTQVIHVTSLADDYQGTPAVGTFRWAMTRTYPRIIIFDVGGMIEMNGMINLDASHSDYYLAGQTAPGGITLHGYGQIQQDGTRQGIVRYITFANEVDKARPPNPPGSVEDKRHLTFNNNDEGIIDHCTSYFSHNEAFNFWHYGSSGVPASVGHTISNSIIGEGDTGSLMGGDETAKAAGEVSAIRNLYVHIRHRHPNITGGAEGEIINTISYNFRTRVTRVSASSVVNYIGNYVKMGSASTNTISNRRNIVMDGVVDGTKVFIDDNNFFDGRYDGVTTANKYEMFDVTDAGSHTTSSPRPANSVWTSSTAFPMVKGVRVATPLNYSVLQDSLLQLNVNGIGANMYLDDDGSKIYISDTKVAQYFNDVKNGLNANGSGSSYGNELGVYDIPIKATTNRPAGFDTDGDGMPNTWELSNGLSTTVDDALLKTLDPNGVRFNIEFYLDGNMAVGGSVAATSVNIVESSLDVPLNGSGQLTLAFTPSNTSDKTGTWTSSNALIATIGANGEITPVAIGATTITFTSNDGSFTDTATVNITAAAIKKKNNKRWIKIGGL